MFNIGWLFTSLSKLTVIKTEMFLFNSTLGVIHL